MPISEHPKGSAALARVRRGNLCAGCGGCALVAPTGIEMRMTPPGFLRPHQTAMLSAAEEALIAWICPGLGQVVVAQDRTDDVLWGPYLSMFTGHATDPDLRFAASSGGALSAILIHLLETGAVDAVVQTTAAASPPHANATIVSKTPAQVKQAAGSRYAPSAPLAGLTKLIEGDQRLAFVGKPCDVAALRALGAVDHRVAKTFPYMLSFFCAGVPSQAGADEVITALGTEPSEVEAFRYRGYGWPGRATATLADGSSPSMSYHDSWGKILSRHVQHRCKLCADGTGTAADLVCADAWHSDAKGYPLFDEQDGISLIVARTQLGKDILEGAGTAGRISSIPFDPTGLAKIQPGQRKRRQALLGRLSALRIMAKPVPRFVGLHITAAARTGSLVWVGRNFLGMVRRVLKGQAP